jgi:hypothetical protein
MCILCHAPIIIKMCREPKICDIVVGKLVCVIYGTDRTNKLLITENRASQAEKETPSRGARRGQHSCHMERKASLSRERDRDGPTREDNLC